jgi:beta-1,2-mannobiose phosphorylase / 1,2-beta-oligomannan phosphorylase
VKHMRLTRVTKDPVLRPRPELAWEKDAVFNTAVVHDGNRFHLLYRAVAHNPGDANRSCIGYAWSSDGVEFERLDNPVLASGTIPEEMKGCEDPRITKLDGAYHMLYTAWDEKESQVALATSTDLSNWERRGILLKYSMFGHNKNAALFPRRIGGRYVVLHRPMGYGEFFDLPAENSLDIMISYSDDLNSWDGHKCLMKPRAGLWDQRKIGIAGPPMETDQGWLLVYHGVDTDMTYRLGVALLDLEDPSKVIRRQTEPILEPMEPWEREGDVPNVVFSCGAALVADEIHVYYGGADKVIGLARGDVRQFLRG